jgi:hypothetical protein
MTAAKITVHRVTAVAWPEENRYLVRVRIPDGFEPADRDRRGRPGDDRLSDLSEGG